MFGRKKLLERIEALEAQIRRLENMHAKTTKADSWESFCFSPAARREFVWCGMEGNYCGRQLTARELSERCVHPQPKQVDYSRITNIPKNTVNTDRIFKVTFEELARLVIDGTPIKREEKVSAKRISEYTEDTTTTITVTE